MCGELRAASGLRSRFAPPATVPTWNVPRLEVPEQMVFDWEKNPDSHRAFGLVLRVFEHLTMAVLAAQKDPSQAS